MLLLLALALTFMLLDVVMKIALVVCSIFLVGYIILLIVLSGKKLFGRFTDGWKKYAMLALKIFIIAEIVFNSIGITVSALYLIFMNIH